MELTYVLIIAPNFAPPGSPNADPAAERAEVIPPFKAVLATPLVYLFPQRISYTGPGAVFAFINRESNTLLRIIIFNRPRVGVVYKINSI